MGTAPMIVVLSILFFINGWYTLLASASDIRKVHIVYMGEKQHDDPKLTTESHLDLLASVVGSKADAVDSMIYSYRHGFSGFAAKLTAAQAQKVEELPGVVHVTRNQLHSQQTTRSWDYLGLSTDPSTNLQHKASMGDGVIIGILDSGVWPELKAFDDEGFGPIPARWKGHCESGQNFSVTSCNRKLIGAKWFIDTFLAEIELPFNTTENPDYLSPIDVNGHGTQISSIAAGSFVNNASYKGLGKGVIRGAAPRARIAMYKVLWNVGGLALGSEADMLRALDEAILDGVDLLSLSIAAEIPQFSDVDERSGIAIGSFHAVAKGIPVICAAGNAFQTAPSAQMVQNTAPWILTVAATTIDRSFPTPLTLGNNITILGQALFAGKEIGFTALAYPENPGLVQTAGYCESLSFNNTPVEGKVVLCFTTVATHAVQVLATAASTVRAAGGVGIIVARNPSDLLVPCFNDFPCVVVDYELGTRMLFYIHSTRSPMVNISPSKTLVGKPVATKVAYFSRRGPNSNAPAILKPDIAAPGVSILAASSPVSPFEDGFAVASGTSAAAPHISGIVALLKVIHPNWSPAAIRSAIVTTAWKTDPFGEPIFSEGSPRKLADPFDFGGGLVNPNKAAEPGLVYDMGTTDYIHYLCAMGYNDSSISLVVEKGTCPSTKPSILDVNLPSITIPNLKKSAILTRTVTNVGPVNSTYKALIEPPLGITIAVSPETLVFNSTTKTISFKVTVSTTHKVNSGYYFGSLAWTNGVYTVTSPISIRTQIVKFYTDDN